jgi:small subunit ribosomal protein S14
LEEYGIKNKERKFGKGSIRCIICGSHDRVIRRYKIHICGRCFREMAKELGFKVMGE